jgi:hypothetical protein
MLHGRRFLLPASQPQKDGLGDILRIAAVADDAIGRAKDPVVVFFEYASERP